DHLYLISERNSGEIISRSGWNMVVGRDVIVPIINSNNPMMAQLQKAGISSGKFALLLSDPDKRSWAVCLSNGQNTPVWIFMPDDEGVRNGLTDFTKAGIAAGTGMTVKTPEEVMAAVQADPYAIGFCMLNDLRAGLAGYRNVTLLPVDKNGNGRMDSFENIYTNLDAFTHGVWIGKYPNALSNNIYAVSAARPVSENELAFLSWILNDGQKLLASSGYCNLTSSETKTGIAALTGTTAGNIPETKTASAPSPWPMILTVSGLIALFFVIFILSKRSVKSSATDQQIHIAPLLIENAIHVPRGLYFDKTHTWAFMEKDGNVKVGVDDFLQHITGKLSKIMMKEPGETVRKGEKIVTIIQNGKQLNLYAPISGTILQQNKLLMSDSSLINLSPYTDGWVYLIEPRNWRRESQFLLMGEKYIEWLRDEFIRLREFISASIKTNNLVYAHVVLQDGGELTDNVLSDMEPEVWEDFQTRFIDTSR
ncbi:MAG TPA: hypothetical protein VN249_03045, partial [Prolixibacteraceae bacterium]|nr:hypothetical protein [Prolixibacteraceae bacterium]